MENESRKHPMSRRVVFGFARLTQRDIIEPGDEYWSNWGTWEQIEAEYVGLRKGSVFGHYTKMRRKEAKYGND